MVPVFNKELRETVESGLPGNSPTSLSVDFAQQSPNEIQNQEQQPFNSVQIVEENDEVSDQNRKSPELDWVISIREKLKQANEENKEISRANVSIYRVPHYLRETDEKAYVPQILSLGPYHHGNSRLRQMETHKWRCLNNILKRTTHDIKIYLDAMKELEERARDCYEGSISLSSNDFTQMMVLDGCFVLELFRGAVEGFQQLGYPRNDPIFAIRGTLYSFQLETIMLENQIPLFVLDRLLSLQSINPGQRGSVEELALAFFDSLMPTDEPSTKTGRNRLESSLGHGETSDPLQHQIGLHCLDVFRRSLLRAGPKPVPRSKTNRVSDEQRQELIHCVTELKESGIKFKRRKTDRFWDIKFKDGVLRIPRLIIQDGTKSLFLNLIAFEQCHLVCNNHITSYVVFMDSLINSHEDVRYLRYCGIIEHLLGSDAEVADLFNRLGQEVVFDINDSYLSEFSEQLNKYCDHRWNKWRASLKHNYFSNPWVFLSLVAAVVLLLLTFAQTFFGIFAYYRPA